MSAELAHAVRYAEAALSGADAHSSIVLGAALQRVLSALSTPPADDMHANNVGELLGEARELVASWDLRGSWTSESPIGLIMRLADALEVASVRPRGTVTEAEVEAAGRFLGMDDGMEHWIDRDSVRIALEAAREARS